MTGMRIRRVAAVALLAAALPGAAAHGRSGSGPPGGACMQQLPPGYAQRVEQALRSPRDVWGNRLLNAPNGPSYAAAAGRLGPLLYAQAPHGRPLTGSGVAYLPFAVPAGPAGAKQVMLHVVDGSEILAGQATGRSIRVLVGAGGGESYGSCLGRLEHGRLAGGWLPILQTAYRDADGTRYTQESFAARVHGTLASFVRLTAPAGATTRLRVGKVALDASPSSAHTLFVRWTPPGAPVTIGRNAYAAARAAVVRFWRSRLDEGASIDVPEQRVQNARRALLVQNLILGARYSIGNAYEELSFPETVDEARVLGEYGFPAEEVAILRTALPARPTPYPNWKMGEKLLGFAEHLPALPRPDRARRGRRRRSAASSPRSRGSFGRTACSRPSATPRTSPPRSTGCTPRRRSGRGWSRSPPRGGRPDTTRSPRAHDRSPPASGRDSARRSTVPRAGPRTARCSCRCACSPG